MMNESINFESTEQGISKHSFALRKPFGQFSVLVFSFCLTGGALGALWSVGGIFCGCFAPKIQAILDIASLILWEIGAIFLPAPYWGPYLLVPFVLPVVGPAFVSLGVLCVRLFRYTNFLADDPMVHMIFYPPKALVKPQKTLTLDSILAHDRQIVSAGDILRWGDISLKQALIDRLATGEVTPRVIRILRGARNDPDEEVRLFANTILTRIEKQFQERIKVLRESQDQTNPHKAVGRASFEYAVSGLMGERLARTFLDNALSSYEQAFRSQEPFSPAEVLTVGATAVALRKNEILDLCRQRLEKAQAFEELKQLRWILLYEEGRWDDLHSEVSDVQNLPLEFAIPPHLLVWKDLPDAWVGVVE